MFHLLFSKSIKFTMCLLIIISGIFMLPVKAAVPDEVQAVFVNNGCLNCHGATIPSGALSLVNADVSEAQLVDIDAVCNANMKRVLAGDPNNSALFRKISMQNPGCGGVMPPGGNLISQADQDIIEDWIVSIGPAAQFGLIEMAVAAVTVQETEASVTLVVNRQFGTQGTVTVDYLISTIGTDTATSPDDYITDAATLTFLDGETSKNVTVVLVDDDVFEGAEVFSATLSNITGGAVLGSQAQTKVTIADNEFSNEPGTFFFSAVSYSANEGDSSIAINVIRSFGAAGTVSVELLSSDGSAISGVDYTSVSETLVFEEGVKSAVFNVVLLEDQVEETNESFALRLANPTGDATIGSTQSVNVTIVDNDTVGGEPPVDPPEEPTDPEPEAEAGYVAAGSLSINWLLLLLLAFASSRKYQTN